MLLQKKTNDHGQANLHLHSNYLKVNRLFIQIFRFVLEVLVRVVNSLVTKQLLKRQMISYFKFVRL